MHLLNSLIAKTLPLIPKSIVGRVSKRYIAGTTLEAATDAVRRLNQNSMMATLDILGEDILERNPAEQMVRDWRTVIDAMTSHRLDTNFSVKLSQLGLRIDHEFCFQNVRSIVDHARSVGNFVRIDMEDSSTTDATLEIYHRLRKEGFANVGVVIQSYMRRSENDVRDLLKLGANVRLCKGIYVEPAEIAFKEYQEIRDSFVSLLDLMFANGAYVGIATHDEYLVDRSYELIKKYERQKHQYEYQMLLGVREALRDRIVADGHRLRVYVPFGEQWYAYSVRRLKENPAIAGYVLKAMLRLNRT
ncbi:MAG: proline dehydrogenase [Ignavibacteria bacterium]|nr:proline dehydrogenase [Ignavibacteria bacterium]